MEPGRGLLLVVGVIYPATEGYVGTCPDVGITIHADSVPEAIEQLRLALREFHNAGVRANHVPDSVTVTIGLPLAVTMIPSFVDGEVNVSRTTDEGGVAAGAFVTAVYANDAVKVWELLSSEGKGFWKGIWQARDGADLQTIQRSSAHPELGVFWQPLTEIVQQLRTKWGEEFRQYGVGATRFTGLYQGTVIVQAGMTEITHYEGAHLAYVLRVPVVREVDGWRVDYMRFIAEPNETT